MLELKNIWLDKGGFSLQDISFDVAQSEYFALLGPTGSGKTLLLEAVAGFQPIRGTVIFDGWDISRLPPENRNFGFVFQDFALFPHMNVRHNICYAGRFLAKHKAPRDLEELADFLGISDLLERDVATLSAGERQRVAIARALYPRPRMLLLDEPLGALDPATRAAIIPKLLELPRHFDTPVIHVTHNFKIAEAIADRIGVLMGGRLCSLGAAAEMLHTHTDPAIRKFLQVGELSKPDYGGGGR
jgi:molybdate/tungstate transport system ATP-binding protein